MPDESELTGIQSWERESEEGHGRHGRAPLHSCSGAGRGRYSSAR